jgi:Mn-dependent DtxR family transcriptional regulator
VDALLSDCDRYLKRIKELEAKFSPETRDRILAALGVGKQSPQYKRVKAELDKLL